MNECAELNLEHSLGSSLGESDEPQKNRLSSDQTKERTEVCMLESIDSQQHQNKSSHFPLLQRDTTHSWLYPLAPKNGTTRSTILHLQISLLLYFIHLSKHLPVLIIKMGTQQEHQTSHLALVLGFQSHISSPLIHSDEIPLTQHLIAYQLS